ncbi:polyketide synthase, partial [Metarhizium hybridum]
MAMEAVSQTTGRSLSPGTGLEMRKVHIVAALTIPATANSSTELFTDLRKSPITNVSSSETWWDFKLTIYREGVPVLHATRTIAIHESAAAEAIEPRIRLSEAELEPSAKQIWYQRFGKGGLNYGPLFQSVNEIWVLRSSADKVVLGMVRLEQKSAVDGSAPARYPFHPITLEAMVQAGILATVAGHTREMQGFLCLPSLPAPRSASRRPRTVTGCLETKLGKDGRSRRQHRLLASTRPCSRLNY